MVRTTYNIACDTFVSLGMLLGIYVACLGAFAAEPDEQAERSRRARCALALSGGKPSPEGHAALSRIPMPREVLPLSYPAAYQRAASQGKVLVCYVGCRGKHAIDPIEGCVVATAPTLAGYKSGTILVAYPAQGGSLCVQEALKCEDHGTEKVSDAVKDAKGKVEKKPAQGVRKIPAPLDWNL
jgi:hypothetical protein